MAMARMTEEEAQALDDFVTNNEIALGPNGSSWLSQRELRLLEPKERSIYPITSLRGTLHKVDTSDIREEVDR
jgi:hypothetical protein